MTWLITSAITNALVVIPLAGVAWLVARYCKRPALAHLVWAAVLVKLLTPAVITVPVPWQIDLPKLLAQWQQPPTATAVEPSAVAQASQPVVRERPAGQGSVVRKPSSSPHKKTVPHVEAAVISESIWTPLGILRLIGFTWVAGSLLFAGRSLYLAWRFNRSLRQARSEEFLNIRMGRLAQANGFTNWPEVVLLDGIFSPMLWGMGRRARLVFPAELAARLDRAASDTLLLHELAHYSRGDHWVRILELAAQILFWWHPVVWFAQKGIEAAEEECCDAWVIERQNSPRRTYAEALLATIDFLNEQSPVLPPVASGLGEISLLRHRLTQIMRNESTPSLSPRVRVAVAICAALIAPLGPAVFASARPIREAKPNKAASAPVEDIQTDRDDEVVPRSPKSSERPTRIFPAADSLRNLSETPWIPPSLWATALSADGKFKLEARSVGGATRITLFNLSDGFRVDLSSDGITCVSFSSDGRFATGHQDGNVRVWNSSTGGIELNLKGSEAAITSLAFAPQAELVAAGNSAGQVLAWDVTAGDERTRDPRYELGRQNAGISCVRWSAAGDRLAISLASWDEPDSAQLLIWNPVDDFEQQRLPLARPAGAISWLGNDSVLVADWDGMASVWELTTGEAVSRLQLDKNSLSAAAWSPDCPLLPNRRAQGLLLEAP